MAKKTKKVGVTGKYGCRYGSRLRKIIKQFEQTQRAGFFCGFCGKSSLDREAIAVWKCRACKVMLAGGAWAPATPTGQVAKQIMLRNRKSKEDVQQQQQVQKEEKIIGENEGQQKEKKQRDEKDKKEKSKSKSKSKSKEQK